MNSKTLKIVSRLSTKDISNFIKSTEYAENRRYGFRVSKLRDHTIDISHIEKLETLKTFSDPFGNLISNPFDYFIETSFQINEASHELTIIKPSRNLPHLLRHLNQTCNYQIAIEPIFLNLIDFLNDLKTLNANYTLKKITFTGTSNKTNRVRTELIGDNLDSEIFEQLSKVKNPILTKATIHFDNIGPSNQLEITEDYRAKFGASIHEDLQSLILGSLRNNVRQ